MARKSIAVNSFYNMIYRGLNVIFPLVTVTYVSRVILASGVGRVSYAQNIAQYFITLSALGIPNYGVREISRATDLEERSKTFSELFFINGISTLFFSISYYLLIFSCSGFRNDHLLYMVVGSSIILNILNVDWFYQGMEEFRYIALRNFFVKLVSLVLVFVLIKDKGDYVNYALITCLAVGGNNVWNIIHLRRMHIRLEYSNLKIIQHLKPILLLFASAISVELYTLLDTTMIGIMCTNESVGYYTNSMKLVRILIVFITSISGVLLPKITIYARDNNVEKCSDVVSKVFSIMLLIFLPCEIGLFLLSDDVAVLLFGKSFVAAGVTLRIASLLICTLGFSNLFGTQVLIAFKKEKLLLVTTGLGAISNVVLNMFLIPHFYQNGAAVASVVSETIVTLLSVKFACRYIKLRIDERYLISLLVSSIALMVVVCVVIINIDNLYLKLIVSTLLGMIVYAYINYAMRNPVFVYFISKINRKN